MGAATQSAYASQAAIDVMKAGGNAIDATIAASALIDVTRPYLGGIGGGGFALVYIARRKKVYAYDFRERAPASATPGMFLQPNGVPIPFTPQRITSGLAVGVPGTVDSWRLLLQKHGTRTLSELLAPAICIAERGFELDAEFVQQITLNALRLGAFTSSRALFLPGGVPPPVGYLFRNPDHAATLREIAASCNGRTFYEGPIAADIANAVQNPPTVPEPPFPVRPGGMTTDDLRRYLAQQVQPTVTCYRGYTVFGVPLPSSGGLTTALILNILSRFDLSSLNEVEFTHLMLQAERLAYVDRLEYLGDPEFVAAPSNAFLNPAYAATRAALIGPNDNPLYPPGDVASFNRLVEPCSPCVGGCKCGGERTPSHPQAHRAPFETPQVEPRVEVSHALQEQAESITGSTNNMTIVDCEGNIVVYTNTLEQLFGSAIVVPGRGFVLNNELTDFQPLVGFPNSPAPFKRPLSSINPTIVLDPCCDPLYALGSAGGIRIITTVVQILLSLIDRGFPDIEVALDQPRIANTNPEPGFPADRTSLNTSPETTVDPALLAALLPRGYQFVPIQPGGTTTANAAEFLDDGRVLFVAESEPNRRQGYAKASNCCPRKSEETEDKRGSSK